MKKDFAKRIALIFLSAFIYITTAYIPLTAYAAPASEEEYQAAAEKHFPFRVTK